MRPLLRTRVTGSAPACFFPPHHGILALPGRIEPPRSPGSPLLIRGPLPPELGLPGRATTLCARESTYLVGASPKKSPPKIENSSINLLTAGRGGVRTEPRLGRAPAELPRSWARVSPPVPRASDVGPQSLSAARLSKKLEREVSAPSSPTTSKRPNSTERGC